MTSCCGAARMTFATRAGMVISLAAKFRTRASFNSVRWALGGADARATVEGTCQAIHSRPPAGAPRFFSAPNGTASHGPANIVSSGCAVAIAGGLLRTSIGSDTGGSVRGPAFYCGVVGLKPTWGMVPKDGVLAMSPSMDHVGPVSATTLEAALTLDVIAGRTGAESAAASCGKDISGLRIAYARDWFATDPQVDPRIVAAMDAAASTLSDLGAVIEQVTLPSYPAIEIAAAAVLHYECFAGHAEELAAHPEHFGRKTFQNLVAGVDISTAEYAEAKRAGAAFRSALDRDVFSRFDAVLTAGALTPALPVSLFGKGSVWTPMRTIGFNISGHPALALPMGLVDGLPVGMQIVGPHHGEAVICQIGDAFERATDHALQRPPALS